MQPFLNQSRGVLDRMLQRAFPDCSHTPAKSSKCLHMSFVAVDVAQEFSLPELFVCPGGGGIAAAVVSMPKAAMNKYHGPALREDDVRSSRKLSDMKSIAKSPGKEKGAKGQFWPSVLSGNARHHTAALRGSRDAHGLGEIPPGCLQQLPLRTSASQSDGVEAPFGRLACS